MLMMTSLDGGKIIGEFLSRFSETILWSGSSLLCSISRNTLQMLLHNPFILIQIRRSKVKAPPCFVAVGLCHSDPSSNPANHSKISRTTAKKNVSHLCEWPAKGIPSLDPFISHQNTFFLLLLRNNRFHKKLDYPHSFTTVNCNFQSIDFNNFC